MRPLGTRVLLKKPEVSEKIGLLYIPEQARQTPQEGTVVAVGPGVTTVQVGDQVLHGRYNTVAVPGDVTLCLAWEKDLMAILT